MNTVNNTVVRKLGAIKIKLDTNLKSNHTG